MQLLSDFAEPGKVVACILHTFDFLDVLFATCTK